MPITFTAVEKTPYRLLYQLTVAAGGVNPATGLVTNRVPPGAGMLTDASLFNGSSLVQLLNPSPPLVFGDNAGARRILFGDGLTNAINLNVPRCKITLTPRETELDDINWAVDANEGESAGDVLSAGRAVLVIFAPNIEGRVAYLDIHFKHTQQR